MIFDLAIEETGNGGDLVLRGNDLVVVYSVENEIYLALFGGNKEMDTPGNNVTIEQSFDYWANNLLYKGNASIQSNSFTERTLENVALNSAGRILIEEAIKKDLEYLSAIGAVLNIKVILMSDNWIKISVEALMPNGSKGVLIVSGRKESDGDFFIQDFNDDFLL